MPTETFLPVKLSESLLTKLGANAVDAGDKIAALLAEVESGKVKLQEADTRLAAVKTDNGAFEARLADVESKVAALAKLDEAAILAKCEEKAEATASKTASAILAKSGGAPLPAASAPANDKLGNGVLSREEFGKLSANEQSKFCLSGGRVQ